MLMRTPKPLTKGYCTPELETRVRAWVQACRTDAYIAQMLGSTARAVERYRHKRGILHKHPSLSPERIEYEDSRHRRLLESMDRAFAKAYRRAIKPAQPLNLKALVE